MSISLQACRSVARVEEPPWAPSTVTGSFADLDTCTYCASSAQPGEALLTGKDKKVVRIFIDQSWPEPDWLPPTRRAIERLTRLPADWDSYGARCTQANAVKAALDVLGRTMQRHSPVPAVVPTVTGGLQLEWHTGGIDLEVEATPDGSILMFCDGTSCPTPQDCEITQDPTPLAQVIATL